MKAGSRISRRVPALMLMMAGCHGGLPDGDEASARREQRPGARIERPASPTPRVPPPAPFELGLHVPSTVARGGRVPLTMTLTNRGTQPATLELRPRGSEFNFFVSRADGVPVWHRLVGIDVPDYVEPRTLAPGEVLTYQALWNQRDLRGKRVPAGAYSVQGVLLMDAFWATETRTLTIVR